MIKTVKYLLFVTAFFVCQTSFSMQPKLKDILKSQDSGDCRDNEFEALVKSFGQLALDESDFSCLPNEILSQIIGPLQAGYYFEKQKRLSFPWEDFIHIVKLRTVSKRWLGILVNISEIADWLGIPPMHLASMMDDAEKIIELKFAGHSLVEHDCHQYSPIHYAIGSKNMSSLKMIRIGAFYANEKLKQLHCFVEDNDENLLQLLVIDDNEQYCGQFFEILK